MSQANEYAEEAEFNEAAQGGAFTLTGIRRGPPRRVHFTGVQFLIEPMNNNEEPPVRFQDAFNIDHIEPQEPPAQRPRLERQDAFMIDNITIEVSRRRTNVNALLALLNSLSSRLKMEYVLAVADMKPDWECSVCLEDEVNEGVVWHPSNCHIFHRKCLQKAMELNVTCPLCRSHTTPLHMAVSHNN
jgi:Ring finger domain